MREVYIDGRRIRPDPVQVVGEGGEAVVYDISTAFPPATALKLWKPPSHPDFQGPDDEAKRNREGARQRLEEQQRKIRLFPANLPGQVIAPLRLATSKAGDLVLGYSMPLIKGAEALRSFAQVQFRRNGGISNNDVTRIFQSLYGTLHALHRHSVVVGDFNYLNVLAKDRQAWLIDADSMQFAAFPCRAFTSRFVDPLLCDPAESKLVKLLSQPYSDKSDWYAYAVMLFETLLCVHPYGGMYEPHDPKKRLTRDARPLKRISVLHPEVVYPKWALPFGYLPDELLHFYSQLLERDWRGVFPPKLIENLRWTKCLSCGTEHARHFCPECAARIPAEAIKEVIRGQLSIRRVFRTSGVILRAAIQDGQLRYLFHENGEFRREDGRVVLKGNLAPNLHYRILGDDTVVASNGQLVRLAANPAAAERYAVESFRCLTPIFDTNERHLYWTQNGRLQRSQRGFAASKHIGDILAGQTWFRVGPKFGFGFYRAGAIQAAFVFDAENTGIKDTVQLPPLAGELLQAACYFTQQRCWFFAATQDQGRTIHRCFLITSDGAVLDSLQGEEGDGSFLAGLNGKCAVTFKGSTGPVHALFSVTDQGLCRMQEENGRIVESANFPDTQGLVTADESLLFAKEGLYLVGRREVRLLTIK